jgi:monoamine oxidase
VDICIAGRAQAMTRRELIERVARAGGYGAAFATMHAMGLLAPVPPAAALELPHGIGKKTKIVILGAGISGLVAAYEMRKAGFECTVLEARSRPGGRNWTIRSGTKIEFTDGSVQHCAFDQGHYLNAGCARIPSIHKTMLGYCKELGVALEIEVNTSRSALLESDRAFGGKPIEMREAINDARGHVSELLAKAIQKGSLDEEVSADDKERMLSFLRVYGDLDGAYAYRGSSRAGASKLPGAADDAEVDRDPLSMDALLDASFWEGMLFEEVLDQQATMFQPVGGIDHIPYAFARRLGGIVKYNSPVAEIRQTGHGVRIVYTHGPKGPKHSIEADYCICCLPLTILQNIPADFSPRVSAALNSVYYDSAYKIAWESRRFWEKENNIYGGISWLSGSLVNPVWYPSAGMFSEKGVLISGYSVEGASGFAALPSIEAKFAASREAVEKLHPGRGEELKNPVYISWGRIPYNLGSWLGGARSREGGPGGNYYASIYREFLVPDGRIYFAGDHCSHIIAWQEGAALAAQHTVEMIVDRVRQS